LSAEATGISLRDEFDLRTRVDLPAAFLDHKELMRRFQIARAAALFSPVAADTDPVLLTEGILDVSRERGARLLRANAVSFDDAGSSVTVGLESGIEIEARSVVLATGYVVPEIMRSSVQRTASSWAIATPPQPRNLWPEGALIWEASENYHYARTTTDGRIIIGGEDDQKLIEPDARDAATPMKSVRLQEQLKALWPGADNTVDTKWAGTFDTTLDGLPLIGTVPARQNIFAAYGYGGNGITFSYLAAELIAKRIAGGTSPLFEDFAIDRDVSNC
jgi:glycine/D-amino acid oxidase-like deaminating enzyme